MVKAVAWSQQQAFRETLKPVIECDQYGIPIGTIAHPFYVGFGDTASLDSFQRQRVSQPSNRFDAQLTYDLQPLLYEQITNGAGATISHDPTNRCARIQFNNTPNGGYAYMQSYKWTYYHPGNSHLIIPTFNFKEHVPNVTKFVGYGDLSNNAIHFLSNGSQLAWRILSNTSLGDETVLQANWNIDVFDGDGPSGITLDISKTQIAVIDLQALYVGRVRVGFDIDGLVYWAHEFKHANRSDYPYIQTATLPVICGMTCSDTVDADMDFICSTVKSEGSEITEEGFGFTIEGTVTAGNGARTHVWSVRPRSTFNSIDNRINFIPESIDVLVTGNAPIKWELVVGQNLTAPVYANVNVNNSGFEYVTAGTLNGNPTIVIDQGYVAASATTKGTINTDVPDRYPITLDHAGLPRDLGTLTLLVTGLGATSAMRSSIHWREVR